MTEHKLATFQEIYDELDVYRNGCIYIEDLFNHFLLRTYSKLSCEIKENVEMEEFLRYCEMRNSSLNIIFYGFDSNQTDDMCINDIKRSFREFNMFIEEDKARALINRIDLNGNLKISINEWKDFLIFHPIQSIPNIDHFWEHVNFIDAGSDWIIPEEFMSVDDKSINLACKRLLCGGIAGAVSRTCTAPLDRIKVMLQVHGYKHTDSGIIRACKYMITEGGVLSLWRGNGINVLKIAPETALKYSLYEFYKSHLFSDSKTHHTSLSFKFISGSLAGVSAQSLIYPLETLKTRMCLRKTNQQSNIISFARTIYQEGGARAFYRGFLINAIGIIPYAGIELTLYELAKTSYVSHFCQSPSSTPNPFVIPIISSFSATCGILVTYPIALIRTKLQSKTSFREREMDSVRGLCRTIWSSSGVTGFYRGLSANLCKVLPASAISYFTFESLNQRFNLKSFGTK